LIYKIKILCGNGGYRTPVQGFCKESELFLNEAVGSVLSSGLDKGGDVMERRKSKGVRRERERETDEILETCKRETE
jgi:hypothetical protein